MLKLLTFDTTILLKFGITSILGLIIGLERELKRKSLGLKTCLVISIVSCLLTIISTESIYRLSASNHEVLVRMDPLRLAAQIVSGIGFLGAGVILKKDNDTILGLTTAAIIWGAAGIGIGVGAGYYIESTLATFLILICVKFIPFLMKYIGPRPLRERELALELMVNSEGNIDNILDEIKREKLSINSLIIHDLPEGSHQLKINLGVNFKLPVTYIYNFANSIHGVQKVRIESDSLGE